MAVSFFLSKKSLWSLFLIVALEDPRIVKKRYVGKYVPDE